MDEHKLRSIEQLQGFLAGTLGIEFAPHANDQQRYEHISRVLQRFDYPRLPRASRGTVLAYLRRTTGYSRAQLTRLVSRWQGNLELEFPPIHRHVRGLIPRFDFAPRFH